METHVSGYGLLSRYRSELMGLAMLWVMLFHAYRLRFGVPPLDGFKAAGFAGVDIFLLLSGMGLYVSLSRTLLGGRLSVYYGRRVSRILPAYWLVMGPYSLWLRVHGRVSLTTAAWSLSTLHYWFHIPGAFNWYVPALLAFYLLSPLFFQMFRRCRYPLALAALPVSYGLYRLSIPLGLNYTEDFLYRLPTFALGCFAGRCVTEQRPLTRRHAAVWTLLAACGVLLLTLLYARVLYINLCYIMISLLMPLCLLLGWLLNRLRGGRLRSFLRLLGENSLEIYLLNVVFTREFDTLAPLLDRGPGHLFYYLSGWALNILLALALHHWIEAARTRLTALRQPLLKP